MCTYVGIFIGEKPVDRVDTIIDTYLGIVQIIVDKSQ